MNLFVEKGSIGTRALLLIALSFMLFSCAPEKRQRSGASAKATSQPPAEYRFKCEEFKTVPVLFRTDGFSQYCHKTLVPTPDGFKRELIAPLAKGGVSIVGWGCNAGSRVTYDSKVESLVGAGLSESDWKLMRALDRVVYKNLTTLIKSGHDPLRLAVVDAHDGGMKLFARLEMNKGYGKLNKKTWIGTLLTGRFNEEHPEYRIPGSLLLDYKYPEVRKYKLALLREMAGRGVDGLMLDFVGSPRYFEDPEKGRQIMTQFIRDVRRMLDEVGAKRKRKLELFIRVCYKDSYERGLDWKACMKEGLIDGITTFKGWPASDYFDYNIDELVAYRDEIKSSCKVYGHIWQSLGLIDTDPRPNSKRRYSKPKTVAMNVAQAALHNLSGCDGIELGFASPQQWRDYYGMLGTAEKIEFADKHYMVDIKPYMPLIFKDEQSKIVKKVKLRVADNVKKALSRGLKVSAKLLLTGGAPGLGENLEVSINGERIFVMKPKGGSSRGDFISSRDIKENASHTKAHKESFLNDPNWYKRGRSTIPFPAELLKLGENEIEFSYAYTGSEAKKGNDLEIRWIELLVEYTPKQGISADMVKGQGLPVAIAEVSSEYRNAKEGPYLAKKLIGGKKSGLHYKGKRDTHSIVSDNFYRSGKKGTMWMAAASDKKRYIIFDLGKNPPFLGYVKIWNWNNPKTLDRGAKEIEIYVSAEKLPFGDKRWELCSRATLSKAPGKHTVPFGDKIVINKKNARYVLLHIKSTYGMKPAGLSEVAFFPGDDKTPNRSGNLEQLKKLFTGKVAAKPADLKAYTGKEAVNAIVGKWRKKAYMANYNQLAANYGNNVEFQLRKKQIILCPQTAECLYSDKMVPKPAYVKGSRPELEKQVERITSGCRSPREKMLAIMRFCRDLKNKPTIKYGKGFLFGGTEEKLIEKGEDLCECLGRLFVALCEIAGIPARIVMHDIGGHITAEAYIDSRWGYVDPKTGIYFLKKDGSIASLWELMLDPSLTARQSAEVKANLHPKYSWDARVAKCRRKYFNASEINGFEYYSLSDADKYNYNLVSWDDVLAAGFLKVNKDYRKYIGKVFGGGK